MNPAQEQAYYTERLAYLNRLCLGYTPPTPSPSVTILPALTQGFVTFGMYNNAHKIQPRMLGVWGDLLARVPHSRLVFKSPHFADPETRERVVAPLAERGIERSRILFRGPSMLVDYLNDYGQVDIALDPYPHNGLTTTLDALWMGVPVVTLKGEACVNRMTYSVLAQLGLEAWAADSAEGYVTIAEDLAKDLSRLKHLRSTLRDRLAASSIMDGSGYAHEFEGLLRSMWRSWCDGAPRIGRTTPPA